MLFQYFEMSVNRDDLLISLKGMTPAQVIAQGICVNCKSAAVEFKDALSRKEYGLSGLCQVCQDKVFGTDDSGEDSE